MHSYTPDPLQRRSTSVMPCPSHQKHTKKMKHHRNRPPAQDGHRNGAQQGQLHCFIPAVQHIRYNCPSHHTAQKMNEAYEYFGMNQTPPPAQNEKSEHGMICTVALQRRSTSDMPCPLHNAAHKNMEHFTCGTYRQHNSTQDQKIKK